MNTNNETLHRSNKNPTLKTACLAVCQKVLKQVQKVKGALLAEYARRLEGQEHALRLALNEAEALAWQTGFPHLVFPELATEKVEALANWKGRQQAVQGTGAHWAFAS